MKPHSIALNILFTMALAGATAPLMADPDEPATVTESSDHILIKSGKPQAVLVIFPGAYQDASKYRLLGEAIVSHSKGEIAVVIADFFRDFANPWEAKARVTIGLDLLKSYGYADASQRLFLAGHSQGGIAANELPPKLNLGGLVLFGSYLPHTVLIGKNLKDYPVPVLTLGGELDGNTGLNYIAREAKIARELDSVRKPVITIPGMNHMQFADGSFLEGDLQPDVSLEMAHTAVAEVVYTFLAAQTGKLSLKRSAAEVELRQKVADSARFVEIFYEAELKVTGLCADLQKIATPLRERDWRRITLAEKLYATKLNIFPFILDKSKVIPQAAGYKLHLPVYVERAPDLLDISKNNYLSPEVIACKLRTLDKLVEETAAKPQGAALNCAEMNAQVIQKSLAMLKHEARTRINDRYGAPETWTSTSVAGGKSNSVEIGPFSIRSTKVATGQDWIAGRFNFGVKDDLWILNTTELQTKNDVLISNFAGANYCKVIAPERVIEWATIFGLR